VFEARESGRSFCTTTGCLLGCRVRFQAETRNVSVRHSVQTGSEVRAPPCPVGMCSPFLGRGLRRPGLNADRSPPSSAEIKNGSSVPLYLFVSWCLIKHRNDFTFA
jgi:hypothetical protein